MDASKGTREDDELAAAGGVATCEEEGKGEDVHGDVEHGSSKNCVTDRPACVSLIRRGATSGSTEGVEAIGRLAVAAEGAVTSTSSKSIAVGPSADVFGLATRADFAATGRTDARVAEDEVGLGCAGSGHSRREVPLPALQRGHATRLWGPLHLAQTCLPFGHVSPGFARGQPAATLYAQQIGEPLSRQS